MANRVYLTFKNKNNEEEELEAIGTLPQLWQELYDLELLNEQKSKLIESYITEGDNRVSLIIDKSIVLSNLQQRINHNLAIETSTKKQLRKDFYNFLLNEVKDDEIICIDFEELSWFYNETEDFFSELELFHNDDEVYQRSSLEDSVYKIMGCTDTLKKYSDIYKQWSNDNKSIKQLYLEEYAKKLKREDRKEFFKNIFYLFLCLVFLVVGVLMLIKEPNQFWTALSGVIFGLIGCIVFGVRIYEYLLE
ncbi:hypothetical protein [Myroides odoratimimus]|uniref:hypothetical protein n=1 Tax=Myroides odoratimimus TaxID=76832 RepID=UPI0025789DBB|nr:hypothetical protein [Myroides odoratimimus]MDM1059539.1 hypothetical protein [Myroides odoratimimus]